MKSSRCISLLLVIAFFIVGCEPATPSVISTQTEPRIPSLTVSPSATGTISTAPTVLSPPLMSMNAVVSTITAPNYLKVCKELNPSSINDQVGYKGIIPGSTTSLEVKNLLGDPISKSILIIDQWAYAGYGISFENDTVIEIDILIDQDFLIPLSAIIKKYGCPQAIFAYDPKEEQTGELGMTSLVYNNIGIEFNFYRFPISMSDNPGEVYLYEAESMEEYLEQDNGIFTESNIIKLVSWDEAVIK